MAYQEAVYSYLSKLLPTENSLKGTSMDNDSAISNVYNFYTMKKNNISSSADEDDLSYSKNVEAQTRQMLSHYSDKDIEKLLKILLKDRTTRKNILWATNEYEKYGEDYAFEKEISNKLIKGSNTNIIRPRISKSKEEQVARTRKSAEVFTPSWICNEMNNLHDETYFGRSGIFNTTSDHSWQSTEGKIEFPEDKKHKTPSWERYVNSRVLEITCGEAPFLVSRYDTTTGEYLPVSERIGLLDRKLRVVNENTENEQDWLKWVKKAYESTYGYEYQGDNLYLARKNLLLTFLDNFNHRWKSLPSLSQLKMIANIITWNIWQMDGLKYCIPYDLRNKTQLELFERHKQLDFSIICRIPDWRNKKVFSFKDLKGDKKMKFDVVIGNPPYQVEDGGAGSSAKPVYHLFISEAKKLFPSILSMIIPSRWMSGGKGLDDFRNEMLTDTKIKRLVDYPISSECFSGVEIKGGVCYFVREQQHNGLCKIMTIKNNKISVYERPLLEENCDVFIRYNEAIPILHKVQSNNETSFETLVSARKPFGLTTDFKDYNLSKGKYNTISIYANKEIGYVNIDKIKQHNNWVDKFKVYITRAYGAGENFPHQILNKPILGEKGSCCTETYLLIGPFNSKRETENVISYIKTKFFRFLILLMKNTQDAPKRVYQFVPMQNFEENWSDEKLYSKYGLTEEEINFINSMVKPME